VGIVVGAWLVTAPSASAQLPLTEPAPPQLARIAYSANGTVYTIAADGSGRTAVAEHSRQPAWSPDGGTVAYARARDDDTDAARIWVSAPDGSGSRPVSAPPRGWSDDSPTWSPDGARIAFVRSRFSSRRGLLSSIVSMAAGGGDERRILTVASTRGTYLSGPAWSPDGARLLVTQERFDEEDDEVEEATSLYLVDVSTGERRRHLRGGDGAWSPSGDRIAYVAQRPSCKQGACAEVYVANADGGGRRLLTRNEAREAGPAWSADGERVAFTSARNYPDGGMPEVYSVRTDGTCLTWLTNGTAVPHDPAWEPAPGLSTDPGACGAVEREPLIETDTRDLARTRAWWLGPRYGNMLVSEAFEVDGDVFIDYADCARFEPSECTQGVGLLVRSVCQTDVLSFVSGFATGRGLTRHEGALVHFQEIDPALEAVNEVYFGSTAVEVSEFDREGPPSPELLDAFRRFGEDAPPGALPRAELPRDFWHTLERTRALRRKLGSVRAVARRLKISRKRVEGRLALDRRLRELGPFGRIDCGD
jgi:TolB protein